MAVFEAEHTARKQHTCAFCLGQIKPGQRYSMQTVPPGDPEIENTRWARTRVHITYKDCDQETPV